MVKGNVPANPTESKACDSVQEKQEFNPQKSSNYGNRCNLMERQSICLHNMILRSPLTPPLSP
jgi:hypothetical protein